MNLRCTDSPRWEVAEHDGCADVEFADGGEGVEEFVTQNLTLEQCKDGAQSNGKKFELITLTPNPAFSPFGNILGY